MRGGVAIDEPGLLVFLLCSFRRGRVSVAVRQAGGQSVIDLVRLVDGQGGAGSGDEDEEFVGSCVPLCVIPVRQKWRVVVARYEPGLLLSSRL